MEETRNTLFAASAPESPSGLAGAIAGAAAAGHFDELRGASGATAGAPVHAAWARFFDCLGDGSLEDLDRRAADLRRQMRDNGVTYNVYSDDPDAPPRPWSAELFPLIVGPEDWRRIEQGVLQRVRVLNSVMADVYGPQQLLASGLLPPALVQGHPGYLREMQGVVPPGGTFLHLAAFDLARDPEGLWWVVSQRTQAPSGLGYLLENRLAISRQFPQAFESMHVQRLADTYRALVKGLKRASPGGDDALIALLTPGPYNETYFEHAYLARYLGLPLVEGHDLLVRNDRLYLKTLHGLRPVHGLLKRLDDEFLDPLELRADSTLGVPGLLRAVRAGHVLVANTPGSAFLESPALLGFLPALARHLLGEELTLPALPTWWCGERAVLDDALPRLAECVIKPTYAGSDWHDSFAAVLGDRLDASGRDEWTGRILRRGDEHTLQEQLPLSQMPTWHTGGAGDGGEASRILPRSVLLRVFAVADGQGGWRVLPGGMGRVAGAGDASGIASMQRGGSSADVWVLAPGPMEQAQPLPRRALASGEIAHRFVSSSAAESLFWLGRYTERAENSVRLARVTLQALGGDGQSSRPLLAWLTEMAVENALVLPTVPAAHLARRVFERSLIDSLAQPGSGSVASNLASLRHAAAGVRERLSQEHWNTIVQTEAEFLRRLAPRSADHDHSATDALRSLESVSGHLAAITGGQTDRMTRDDGWRLLSSGRHIERLAFLSQALQLAVDGGALADDAGFEAVLALFDSTITFHAQYQQMREPAALVELLVLDRDNPRSLGWVAQTLRGRLARVTGSDSGALGALLEGFPNPDLWSLEALCGSASPAGVEGAMAPSIEVTHTAAPVAFPALTTLLTGCADSAFGLSDAISARYFTHSADTRPSPGG